MTTRALFIDIETLANAAMEPHLPEPQAPANYEDPKKIAAYVERAWAKAQEEMALDIDFARIVALGYAVDDDEPSVLLAHDDETERAALARFWELVPLHCPIIGYNLRGFDLPIIFMNTTTTQSQTPPPWTITRKEYQLQQAHTVAGGVPIIDVADGREHKRQVTQALAEGRAVPSEVLADYPELANTHHRHPHNAGQTLCSRPILRQALRSIPLGQDRSDDTLSVSDDPDEVTCPSCLCYARRGYGLYGEPITGHTAAGRQQPPTGHPQPSIPIEQWDRSWESHPPPPGVTCARCGRPPATPDEVGWCWACGQEGVYSCPDCLAKLGDWKTEQAQASIACPERSRREEARERGRQAAVKAAIEDSGPITQADQAEYHRWELHLITGDTRGRSFKRALKEIERPGVLRLALEQIDGADPKRRELIERRLTRLANPRVHGGQEAPA